MYNYLASFIWKQEEELEEADQKAKRQKYLCGEIIKKSNFKLRTNVQEPINQISNKPSAERSRKKILPIRPEWARVSTTNKI